MSTAYVNGRYIPFAEAALPLDDPGFVWGAVITDRCRTFRGVPFQLGEHVARFRRSCGLAYVPLSATDDELREIAVELVHRNYAGDDLSVVFLATPGPTLIVHTVPVPAERVAQLWRDGAILRTDYGEWGAMLRIKHRSRLGWWTATKRVQQSDPAAELLCTDNFLGVVYETPSANLLAVFDGSLYTPSVGSVLNGIALQTTRILARGLGLSTAPERLVDSLELRKASEVFLTNSTFCIAPVARIDDYSFPTDGPVLTRLQAEWSRLVGVEIGRPAS